MKNRPCNIEYVSGSGRRAILILLLVLLCGLLTACGSVPDGMDKDETEAAALEVVQLLADGRADEVYALLRPDIAADLSTADIEALVPSSGDFEEVTQTDLSVETVADGGEEYAMVVMICRFTDNKVRFSIGLDRELALIGLRVEEAK